MKPSELKDLRIAIVGGGYGGAAAAKALQNIGAENVHVYEQATKLTQIGAGIGLRPASMDLFRQWGIFDTIAAVSTPSDQLNILSADGKTVIAQEPWPGLNDYEVKTHCHLIHRGDFIDALLSTLPEGMVHIDHKLVKIEDKGNEAELTFENGNVVTADVVIGADGIRSTVRKQLFTDAEPVFSGEHAYRAVISMDDSLGLAPDNNPRFYMGDDGTVAYNLPLRTRNELSYDITAKSDDASWAPDVTIDDIVATIEGFEERIVEIAKNLDITKVTSRAVFDIDPVDTWHSDCVALLGDSAHAMLHHQGQGANSAIQDAGGLADAFANEATVAEALAAYQAERKPITDHLQKISRQGWAAHSVESAFPGQDK
ncbi:FAD-dependent monooxygenase [Enteractinococcus helveticum]|uniref:Monooxygenase n=1 Tax=Enteractinococcus helveticum TaxID=1837282 RepID=A0A1B7M190_9MICC|nr:FAD-dependent monooxygenase [Enteractinococcus helveticum]OAV62144.1 monooxygenase [Enteractinococcus helveticum]